MATSAEASEPQYRQLTLVDGRVYFAEILETVPEGLRLRMPQGESTVPFELLKDMIPTTVAEYASQAPWRVWVSSPHEELLLSVLGRMEGIEATRAGALFAGDAESVSDSASRVGAIGDCRDLACLSAQSKPFSWRWLIVTDGQGDAVRLMGKTNTDASQRANPTEGFAPSEAILWEELHTLFELALPEEEAPSNRRPTKTARKERGAFDRQRVMALSFVPVPGLPSLAQGDQLGFAESVGIVGASTIAWAIVSDRASQSAVETFGMSFAGFYTVTVLSNQVLGMRSLEKGQPVVGIAPTAQGGTAVTVGARF